MKGKLKPKFISVRFATREQYRQWKQLETYCRRNGLNKSAVLRQLIKLFNKHTMWDR